MNVLRYGFFAMLGLALVIPASDSVSDQKEKSKKTLDSIRLQEVHMKALKARSIGPAVMGGRVSSIALDPEEGYMFYVGLGTGGIMKTSSNGASFDAIFEKESVAAIGAIAVSPSNKKFVWVGSGEANDRNSSSWGNGVYLSSDAGATWNNVGLKSSKTIARIVLHPTDSNTAWVAAMGDLWTSSAERGLYKTTDAGKAWKLVLSTPSHQNNVGCGDVAIDPSNPSILYAALYARRRTPWSFVSGTELTDGKDLGGIFKSVDGGTTWKKLQKGLPHNTQRIGIDVYRKSPNILYSVVQSNEGGTASIGEPKSKHGGVFRSEDGGESWMRMNSLDPRPFYFSQIRIDPSNDQRIYVLGFMLHVSEDGGKSFREEYFDKVHSDCHDLVIDPKNPKRLLLGTDGGVYQSFASGKGWDHLSKFAAGEFYRIAVDDRIPYRIAGGLQDNLNWVGPSATRSKEGIRNSDWMNIGGGDGFYCVFDPFDSNVVYAESQEGYVHRYNMWTGETKGLRPEPSEGQPAFRFHWNSPLIPSRIDKGALYLAGNKVFKLMKNGEEWKVISPDLSTQDPQKTTAVGSGAENFGVVYTLAESPVTPGLLWAGTDDGKLWMTTNEGASWTDLTNMIPKPARGMWISRIEAGWHDSKAAYLAVDGHRSGMYSVQAYRTTDAGKSWQSIAGDLPSDGPVKVLREDPNNLNLLFAGTEFNLFVSADRGVHWLKLGELPTVAVDDILVHPRDLDLVVATHGRSLYIIDDIRPLEQLTAEVEAQEAFLFPPRAAYGFYPNEGWTFAAGTTLFRGANPPDGAIISYYIKEYTGDPAKISIADSAGKVFANISGPAGPGINRISWDLRMTKDLLTDYGGEGQKFVRSGEYTITLTYGKAKKTQKIKVNIAAGIETK